MSDTPPPLKGYSRTICVSIRHDFIPLLENAAKRWGGKSRALYTSVAALQRIYQEEFDHIKQTFTGGELTLIKKRMNGVLCEPEDMDRAVISRIEELFQEECGACGVQKDALLKKLKIMKRSRMYALIDWTRGG